MINDCERCGEMFSDEDLKYVEDWFRVCESCRHELTCAKCGCTFLPSQIWNQLRICKDCLIEIDAELASKVFVVGE